MGCLLDGPSAAQRGLSRTNQAAGRLDWRRACPRSASRNCGGVRSTAAGPRAASGSGATGSWPSSACWRASGGCPGTSATSSGGTSSRPPRWPSAPASPTATRQNSSRGRSGGGWRRPRSTWATAGRCPWPSSSRPPGPCPWHSRPLRARLLVREAEQEQPPPRPQYGRQPLGVAAAALAREDVEQAAVDHVGDPLPPALQRQGVLDQERRRQAPLGGLPLRPADRLLRRGLISFSAAGR